MAIDLPEERTVHIFGIKLCSEKTTITLLVVSLHDSSAWTGTLKMEEVLSFEMS
jgi:hypothetical protein